MRGAALCYASPRKEEGLPHIVAALIYDPVLAAYAGNVLPPIAAHPAMRQHEEELRGEALRQVHRISSLACGHACCFALLLMAKP